ncbi:MAG: endolytic transglycosylase MltG [Ruminococcaceae bacterium]|nr:endolytic transglycosylase MltG [Oscillospiraceae bacterium]
MSNEKQNPQLPGDDSWLDEILGFDLPKEKSTKELAGQTGSLPKAEPAFDMPGEMPPDMSDDDFWESLKRVGITDDPTPEPNEVITPETSIDDILGETVNPLEHIKEHTQPIPKIPVTPVKDPTLVPLVQEKEPPLAPIEKAPQPPKAEAPKAEKPVAPQPPKKRTGPKLPKDDRWQPVPTPGELPPTAFRPKRKTGYGLLGIPHILTTLVWLVTIVICGVTLGRTLWVCCADLMAFGKGDTKITVTITDREVRVLPDGTKKVDVDSISEKLANAGLIEYPKLFKLFVTATNKDQDIIAGTFTLNCYYDYNAMVNAMSYYAPAREEVTVTIPEGYTCAQIFRLLEENSVCTVEELEEWAATGELKEYWFLEGVSRGDKYSLEGFLFPDTYDFYTNDDPQRVLEKFLNNFDARFTDLMKEDLLELRARFGKDFTIHDVVIIASIIEKETSSVDESYDISSVFYNRLTDPNFYPRYLGADATVHYAIGDYFGQIKELTQAHLDTDSPYNTRNHEGIPPGAISSPGRDSLYAALTPNVTDYLYFVYDPDAGHHLFTNDYNEHLRNIASLGD